MDISSKKILSKVTICLLAVCMLATPVVSSAATVTYNVKPSVQYGQTEARKMFKEVNKFRVDDKQAWYWNEKNTKKIYKKNLKSLKYDYNLEKVAMQRAAEIALSYSHTRPNGKDCFTAFSAKGNKSTYRGENIAAGYETYLEVFEAWKETDEKYAGQGHRRNMLNENFTTIGIGHVYYNGYHYWVQVFGNKMGSSKKTTANDKSTLVTVAVKSTNITSKKSAVSPQKVTVGSTKSLPIAKMSITLKGNWPGTKCVVRPVTKKWATSNSKVVSVNTSKLTYKGVKVGKTNLKLTALGKSVYVPTTVVGK